MKWVKGERQNESLGSRNRMSCSIPGERSGVRRSTNWEEQSRNRLPGCAFLNNGKLCAATTVVSYRFPWQRFVECRTVSSANCSYDERRTASRLAIVAGSFLRPATSLGSDRQATREAFAICLGLHVTLRGEASVLR